MTDLPTEYILDHRDRIIEVLPDSDFMFADGFDEAIIGVESSEPFRVIYDTDLCIDILAREMSRFEVQEFFDFNVAGAYVGEKTPIFTE